MVERIMLPLEPLLSKREPGLSEPTPPFTEIKFSVTVIELPLDIAFDPVAILTFPI
jgi:hypothetical protein